MGSRLFIVSATFKQLLSKRIIFSSQYLKRFNRIYNIFETIKENYNIELQKERSPGKTYVSYFGVSIGGTWDFVKGLKAIYN